MNLLLIYWYETKELTVRLYNGMTKSYKSWYSSLSPKPKNLTCIIGMTKIATLTFKIARKKFFNSFSSKV
jgi:hypothetical protein